MFVHPLKSNADIKLRTKFPYEFTRHNALKFAKKGNFLRYIAMHTIYYHPKILKLTFSTEEICTFKNDFTKTIFADFTFLFDFVIYLFCTIFLILEQCARQPMGIIFSEMAKYLSLIMYVKIVNKFLKPK